MKPRTIALVAVMWITIGVVHALSRYADIVKYGLEVPFTFSDVGYYVLSYASWIVVTLGLLRILGSPRFALSGVRLGALFIGGMIVWLPLYFAFDFGMSTLVAGGGWSGWLKKFAEIGGSLVFFYAVVYALTFAMCVGVVLATRAREAQQANLVLERQRAQAALALAEQQVQAMQAQLSPHFLFNCLGSISYLARRAEKRVLVDAVARLGRLLRFTVENASRRHITVADELGFARDYLDLQSLRFGDRFRCAIESDETAEHAACVPFSLQPLIENVFRHAVEQVQDGGDGAPSPAVGIRVNVAQRGGMVQMRVCNSQNVGDRRATARAGYGTGINNLRARLAHTYGDDYTLDTAVSPDEYCVALQFPAEMAAHDA